MKRRLVLSLSAALLLLFLCQGTADSKADRDATRKELGKTMGAGNYKDAYEGYRKLALDPQDDPLRVGEDLKLALQCLANLNRVNEIDELREAAIKVHEGNWRLLFAAAETYLQFQHEGFIVSGEFRRGPKRGGGEYVNAMSRDRIRALQLMVQAMPRVPRAENRSEAAAFFLRFASILLSDRGYSEAWRLQYVSDLSVLPDYEPGWGYRGSQGGAPVDADGNPIYHHAPESFEAAKTDGERWRWCLQEAMELDPSVQQAVRFQFADFLRSQFGEQTMADFGWRFEPMEDEEKDATGTYALHTLGEDEAMARLAVGVRRWKLPDEFNFIKIYREIAEGEKSGYTRSALENLAEIFENRRQYPSAAKICKRLIAEDSGQTEGYRDRLEQIEGNWGRFEPNMTQPAGKGATVEYRFRNGTSVEFTAAEIKVDKLLDDVKAYLRTKPGQLDWDKVNIGNIGYRIVYHNQKEYLGREVARWDLKLEPRKAHFDKRITVTTPLQKPGAYFVTAKMAGGNTHHIILWLADTVIAKKPLSEKAYYFVADAVTGKPIPKANVEFFGYKQRHVDGNKYEIAILQFAEFTDADGEVIPDPRDQLADYQWIVTARTAEGRFAYLGFNGVWYQRMYDAEYQQTKAFLITDRPVYRPDQSVKYKFWVRRAKYDMEDASDYAGQSFQIQIFDPKGEKMAELEKQADAYAGLEGDLKLAADATLGVYRINIRQGNRTYGGGTFRVEEYKKPEFEVTVDAPEKPAMLGDKIETTIKAKYYFGSPVTQARVKYKVLRTGYTQRWYPPRPWDWFYGPGYWWFSYDYEWYPGFMSWGCRRPHPFWWSRMQEPPEVVAERDTEIGPDGTVKVEIDTGLAKAIHGDQDHRYSITAEVVDASRRTIVGSGEVLVARKPFQVYTWVDRGYYRVGDTIQVSFSARTPDAKPVEGKGELSLIKIRYEKNEPVEAAVQSWKVDTDVEGKGSQQIKASQGGQYRLSYKLTDAANHTIEGGYLFTIMGEGFDGSEFRFNHIELVPEKREYAPGETVKLQINTDRVGSTVLLFVRPTNGIYLEPKVLRLAGKSTVEEIAVVKKDMPNFFIEALTVADGKVHTEAREIAVPPEKRILSVDLKPSSATYKPGEKAKVEIQLKDFSGQPFVGSTVVAIYDKSVEYIAGGTNVPEIREFFWKWRRHHSPWTEHSLQRGSEILNPRDKPGMMDIGIFGATGVDELSDESGVTRGAPRGREGGFGGGRGFGANAMAESAAAPGAAPMALRASKGKADGALGAAGEESEAQAGGWGAEGGEAPEVQPSVRKEFADTALWVGALETRKDGTAEVELKMPENLTTWRVKVWGMGHGTKVGHGSVDVVTRKDLIVRLQAPRFFVEKDEVVLSANVHNYLSAAKDVRVVLELEGGTLELMVAAAQKAKVEPKGEARVDWRVKVLKEGEAVVRMKALTDEESDAMEMRFPCHVHGMLKMESWSGAIRPDEESGTFKVRVPAERRPAETRLEVRFSPTLAGALVDALPYLVDYPYGCTEQTLNRFLPTVITQKILLEMNLDLKAIEEKRANLNAQEIGDDRERAKGWKRFDRNPVFDEAEVLRMVKEGLKRLTEMQLSDGGWGWFSGWGEHPSPHTTAVVVHGLQVAKACDVALVPKVLERGVEWLKRYQEGEVQKLENALKDPRPKPWKDSADNLDAFVYMVLADAGLKDQKMLDFLYRDRTKIAVYSLAMYGMALHVQGEKEKLDMVLRNIGQYLVTDDENQTAWLNLPGGFWWYWYGSEYEAHAYYLKLLARTDPKGAVAPRLVKYLLNNRKHAAYWNSTRDTALCIEAMADFLRASGEQKPEMTVEIWVDGEAKKGVEISSANLFTFDNKFVLEGEKLSTGEHVIELKKKGKGPLYFNGYLTNFTLEDSIARAGLEVKVGRTYYKLEKAEKTIKAAGSRGQVVDQKVEKYERKKLENLSMLKSGDLVEIELEIESKNDYEYLVFEDMKPAGFEPVDLRSGYNGNPLGAYMEFRDNRVVFFVRALARGKHSVSYRMRAEIPGKFSALPTRAWAMYAPELKGNSDEIKLKVED